MIRIPGALGKDLCDNSLGLTRRDILRVGASGMLGMSLGGMLEMQASQEAKIGGSWLGQGQEHHHDLPSGWSQPSRLMGSKRERP